MVMFQKIVLLLMVFACAHAKLSYNQEQQKKEDEASAAAVLRENDVSFELSLGVHKKSDGIVMNAIEYEGIIGPDTKGSIIVKLDAIWSWLDNEERAGTKRYNDCWMWCNDMKNWYSAASNMKTVEAQWKTKIDTTKDSSDAFKKWGQDSINGIKNGSNTCWGGFGCKDSTEYNRIYKDMANRLQNILDDKSFTDSPTAAPTLSPSVSPTAAPTPSPSVSPTAAPTPSPSVSPIAAPTPSPFCEDKGSSFACGVIKKHKYCNSFKGKKYCQKTCGYCKINSDYLEI